MQFSCSGIRNAYKDCRPSEAYIDISPVKASTAGSVRMVYRTGTLHQLSSYASPDIHNNVLVRMVYRTGTLHQLSSYASPDIHNNIGKAQYSHADAINCLIRYLLMFAIFAILPSLSSSLLSSSSLPITYHFLYLCLIRFPFHLNSI